MFMVAAFAHKPAPETDFAWGTASTPADSARAATTKGSSLRHTITRTTTTSNTWVSPAPNPVRSCAQIDGRMEMYCHCQRVGPSALPFPSHAKYAENSIAQIEHPEQPARESSSQVIDTLEKPTYSFANHSLSVRPIAPAASAHLFFAPKERDMTNSRTALIISDFPIVGLTADTVFRNRYLVVSWQWAEFAEQRACEAELVVADVTTIDRESAFALLRRVFPDTRVVICSLHRNEIEVYRMGHNGLRIEAALPSLFALAA
jgi:hypothetical protein